MQWHGLRPGRVTQYVLVCVALASFGLNVAVDAAAGFPTGEPGEWKCFLPLFCYNEPFQLRKLCPKDKRTCPPKKCRPVRGLYKASKVVDAEIGSHIIYKGGPYMSTPAECCKQCSDRKSCNVWNFCWDPCGCGAKGSCTAFGKVYPKGPMQFPESNPIRGGFGDPCTKDGRFPQFFCTLRQANSTEFKSLRKKGSHGAHSWTSGKING